MTVRTAVAGVASVVLVATVVVSVAAVAAQTEPAHITYLPAVHRPWVPTPMPTPERTTDYGGVPVPAKGRADAPVLLLEFSDYLCPYCRDMALHTMPEVERDFVASGQVSTGFVDFVLASHGVLSRVCHEAARCAGEVGAYWAMHDTIFEAQSRLYSEVRDRNDLEASRVALVTLAEEIDLDGDVMRACLESERHVPDLVALYGTAWLEDNVRGTPTLILVSAVNKRYLDGNISYAQLRPILEREVRRALATPQSGDRTAGDSPVPLDAPALHLPLVADGAESPAPVPTDARPEATPTAAATIAPVPKPQPALEVLPNRSQIGGDPARLVGEVRNNGSTPRYWVEIEARYLDADGGVLATHYSAVRDLPRIEPRQQACFAVSVPGGPPAGWRTYTLSAHHADFTSRDVDVHVVSHEGEAVDYGDGVRRYSVTGELRNWNGLPLSDVQARVTAYGRDDVVVGCENSSPRIELLEPGSVTPFEVMIRWPAAGGQTVERYRLEAYGWLP